MNDTMRERDNPLARAALALPSWMGRELSMGLRVTGVALAVLIAAAESYERTRAFAVVVAALALLSLSPALGGLARRLPWVGAGVLFFGGALLAHLALGKLLIAAGALAALAAAIDDRQRGRMTGAPSFFAGLGLTALSVALIVLGIEG